jgi:hypothetical protein
MGLVMTRAERLATIKGAVIESGQSWFASVLCAAVDEMFSSHIKDRV